MQVSSIYSLVRTISMASKLTLDVKSVFLMVIIVLCIKFMGYRSSTTHFSTVLVSDEKFTPIR